MFDAIIAFLQTGDTTLIAPFISAAVHARVTQELFVWGIVFIVIDKKVKKFLAAAKEDLGGRVSGIETAIGNLTKAITKVEETHFFETGELGKRLDRHANVQKEFDSSMTSVKAWIREIIFRVRTIETKLEIPSPDQNKEINI